MARRANVRGGGELFDGFLEPLGSFSSCSAYDVQGVFFSLFVTIVSWEVGSFLFVCVSG